MNYPPPSAPPWLILGFVFLPMLVMCLAQWGLSLAWRREASLRWLYWGSAAGLLIAMVGSLILAARGSLAEFQRFPPPFLPLTFGCIVLWVLIATSRLGRGLQGLPLVALVGFQAFRLPLELMMHVAAEVGVMPPQMTFAAGTGGGYNLDIVSGATAALLAVLLWLGKAPRWLLLGWNALSTVLLAVIVIVAVVSAPPLVAFGAERANSWIAYAPFVWLPTVLVPAAVSGHVLLWQRLLQGETSLSQGRTAPEAAAIDSRA